VVAEVLHAVAAEPAVAVNTADPGDADARAGREGCGCAFNNFADDLMAGDDARVQGLEIALDDVKIGAADTAGEDFEQHFAGLWFRTRNSFDGKPCAGVGRRGIEDGCAHRSSSEDKITLVGGTGVRPT
jgi:hypothetical protein